MYPFLRIGRFSLGVLVCLCLSTLEAQKGHFTSRDFFKNQALVGQKAQEIQGQKPYSSDLLKEKDISSALQPLFDLHLSVKKWDVELLKKSIRVYFDHFDPEKLYLLNTEVQSLFRRSDTLWEQDLKKLENGDWQIYERVGKIIGQAIWRARGWKKEILFQPSAPLPQYLNYSSIWASSLEDLRLKRAHFFWKQKELLSDVEFSSFLEFLTLHENRYLFQNGSGQRMDSNQVEHEKVSLILDAVVASLDSHSRLIDRDSADQMRRQLEKRYVGVGIWIQEGQVENAVARGDAAQENSYFVGRVLEGSPAFVSGKVKKGDRILKIQGQDLSFLGMEQVSSLMQGEEGQVLELLLEREEGNRMVSVTLVRRWVEIDEKERVQVELREVPGGVFARLKLDSFYESDEGPSSAKDLENALLRIQKEHTLKGLILDLRGNTGGYLTQAVKVAGLFIPTGVVAIAKYSDESVQLWRDEDPVDWFDGPMLVLVSKLSASASEIVAQCLQDYGVALVIGDARTYGKGSIQFHNLTDQDAVRHYKVTVGRYYTVSGRTTQLEGVVTDLVVPGPYYDQMIGERFSDNPLSSDRVSSFYQDTLSDLGAKEKVWYLKSYLPHMQKKELFWRRILSYLRKTSEERVTGFMENLSKTDSSKIHEQMEQFQIDESFNVLKEMLQHENLRKD